MGSYDFENEIRGINTWNSQWNAFCEELVKYGENTPLFEDVVAETKTSFGHVIQQTLFDNLKKLEIPLNQIRYFDRAVNEPDKSRVTEGRFIPQPEYASLNRMNDTDRLYTYMSISYGDSGSNDVLMTALKELRAEPGDSIWKCRFDIPEELKDAKVIDLSTVCRIPDGEEKLFRFLIRQVKKRVNNQIIVDKAEVNYWMIQAVLHIFEKSKMFEPIDKIKTSDPVEQEKQDKEQRLRYKPFHVICDYLERQGYYGIIYKSSVYKRGRCLALFNPAYAKCQFDTCEKIDLKKYEKKLIKGTS